MPNWCSNETTIIGPAADVANLLDTVEAAINPEEPDERGFHLLYPTPNPATPGELTEAATGALAVLAETFPDWYAWRLENWGTKWGDHWHDISKIVHHPDHDEVTVTYDTAWAPPLQLLRHISEAFPTLTFITWFIEGGMDFCGVEAVRDGTIDAAIDATISWVADFDFPAEDEATKPSPDQKAVLIAAVRAIAEVAQLTASQGA